MSVKMKAIILAAGRGKRMGSLTDDKPKCLININGESLFDRLLANLHGSSVKDVGVVTGYKREHIPLGNCTEFHNGRWEKTQMLSSLMCAEAWLDSETCLVIYSDIFFESHLIRDMVEVDADLAVAFDPNWLNLWSKRFENPLSDAESFRINEFGIVTEIGQKASTVEEIEGQYMGVLKISPYAWQEIKRVRNTVDAERRDLIDMTGILQAIILDGNVKPFGVPYIGKWGELDDQVDLEAYS